eukprot:CAMPEP_0113902274 /NCGR_PEP_ID=MMETSP0780_2-20120614/21753_1 /TAXON_ID=652834 /ORGANISM="Palpitomonas bilix" /LENGTH=189 /DNA_ID=CAMNT_0000895049 /DNA_START=609 /DNA_END=1178 /DNA_ORIENTATION=+ /assembly_acc=CAM_ASM_000599
MTTSNNTVTRRDRLHLKSSVLPIFFSAVFTFHVLRPLGVLVGVRNQANNEANRERTKADKEADQPSVPTKVGSIEESTTQLDNDDLHESSAEENGDENYVLVDTLENILLIHNFSGIDLVEDLQINKHVEHGRALVSKTLSLKVGVIAQTPPNGAIVSGNKQGKTVTPIVDEEKYQNLKNRMRDDMPPH